MMMNITDSHITVALVTGASDGIGRDTARQLAIKGVKVILGSRSLEHGQRVLDELKQSDSSLDLELLQLDVDDEAGVRHAAAEVERRHGRLDILINNAGIALDRGPVSQMSNEDFIASFETNVFGTFRVTRYFLPLLKRSLYGRIVNVSSSLASVLNMTDETSPYYHIALPVYASSKVAMNVFTHQLAHELMETGIEVEELGIRN